MFSRILSTILGSEFGQWSRVDLLAGERAAERPAAGQP